MKLIRKITSRDNDQLKYARRVRDGREAGKIFLEGRRLVEEAARSRIDSECIFMSRARLDEPGTSDLVSRLLPQRIFEVSESVLQSLGDTNATQGIIAVAERPQTGREMIVLGNTTPLVVYLHEINNPSNLGAVIRTAEAAGVAGVVVSRGSADVFSSKALRAAMGSSLRVPIWTGVELTEVLDWARENRLRAVAADIKATRSYTEIDWQVPRMLVMGSEAHGLDSTDLAEVDELVFIPMANGVESLNVAVACGVILFEARRQSALR